MRLVGAARAPSLTFAHAVSAGDRSPVPVLLARMEMHWVAREVTAAGLGEVATVTLWDAPGRILMRHPDPQGFLGRTAPQSAVGRAILSVRGEGTIEADGVDGVRRLYAFTRLGSGVDERDEVFLSLGVPAHVVFAEQRRLERRNLLLLALASLLALVAAWLGGDRLLVRLFGRMQHLSERDALTGLANRRRLFAVGDQEQRRARRFGRPLAAVILDLDRFKPVNDRHGHGAGDDVLREVGRRISATVRETDLPARYGGEEFAVILPETDLETAREVAERIRLAVTEAPVATRRGPLAVTLSGGVALLDAGTADLPALLDAADAALYAAKAAGRNRVSVAPAKGPHEPPPAEAGRTP
jgi:diguanylate cyclase (GGDEF)-like protein